jgi:glyoxylase-like metal-dependent hydrolase (beta-lactamase superfamily II)
MRHLAMPARPANFCQIHVGDIEVTFVPDGYISFSPTGAYPGSSPELWEANGQYLDDAGLIVMSLGVLLVRTGGKMVLVDLGWGPASISVGDGSPGTRTVRGTGGTLIDNLARLGVRPGDIDAVLFSHLHGDHTGWIIDPAPATGRPDEAGAATFARAAHYLSEAEWDYWTTKAPGGAGPAPSAEQLAVLGARMTPIGEGAGPVPGIEVMPTPGHTPGHLSFVISSGTDRALVLGDAVHCPIEIDQPELTFSADVDPAMAQRTRIHIEQELSRPGTVTAGPHFSDLVFGRLLKGEGRSMWQFPQSQVLAVPA